MFRIAANFSSARICMFRHRIDTRIASISRYTPALKYQQPRERETCLPPPPPPPPSRDYTLFFSVVGFLIASGAFAVYAKSKPELRDWLTINAPWLDDFIAVVYQERYTYSEFATHVFENTTNSIIKYLTDEKPRQCSGDGTAVQFAGPVNREEDDEDDEEGDYVIVNLSDVERDEKVCEKLPAPVITKDICEIENCLRDLGDVALYNYMTCRDACMCYNKFVEETFMAFNLENFNELKEALVERKKLIQDSLEKATCALAKLEELAKYLECGVQAPKEVIRSTMDVVTEYCNKIQSTKLEYMWEHDKSLILDLQVQKVEEALNKYMEEAQTMFSGLKYTSTKPTLTGDPDLLLYHTYRYIEKLKKDVAETSGAMTERINRALESLPQSGMEKMKSDMEMSANYAKQRVALETEYKRRYELEKAAYDQQLKTALRKQLQKHDEDLKAKLHETENLGGSKLNEMVGKAVAAEKMLMARQLNEMSDKIKMIETKLREKLRAEQDARKSQELWSAGASLLAATKKGGPFVNVDKEIKAIEKVGDGDKLVETVVKAIPKSVRENGVVPESVLRQKYQVMESTAMKVALVEQEGAPLPVYIMSLLQYMFLFMRISGIPQEEYEKPPKEPAKDLDTFDLLQRARFYMDRGDLASALSYVNSLGGASLAASAVWRAAAKEHLDTRHAAEAVIAHALALALQYV